MNPNSLIKSYLYNGTSYDMAVDGSTPVTFTYTVPKGYTASLTRVIIYLEGAGAFSAELFADQTALTNGVLVQANGVTIENWKDNVDLQCCFFDAEGRAVFAKSTKSIGGRWTFSKDAGGETLSLPELGKFSVTIRDNLSNLLHFRVKLGGLLSAQAKPRVLS